MCSNYYVLVIDEVKVRCFLGSIFSLLYIFIDSILNGDVYICRCSVSKSYQICFIYEFYQCLYSHFDSFWLEENIFECYLLSKFLSHRFNSGSVFGIYFIYVLTSTVQFRFPVSLISNLVVRSVVRWSSRQTSLGNLWCGRNY